jgi:hypothetical protein
VQADRAALVLVGVQQGGPGPPFEHPGEFPGQVVGVLDSGVHAGSAASGHPVCRVADEEYPALAVAVSGLGGKGEGAEPLDPWPQTGHPGSGGYQVGELLAGLASDGRADRDPPFDDGPDHVLGGVDAVGGHEGRVFDPVHTVGYRVGDGPGAVGVCGDWQSAPHSDDPAVPDRHRGIGDQR